MKRNLVLAGWVLTFAAVAWGQTTADSVDVAAAKERGVPIETVLLEKANERIASLNRQVAELKAELASTYTKLQKATDAAGASSPSDRHITGAGEAVLNGATPPGTQPVNRPAHTATRPAETTLNLLATSLPKELRPSADETATKRQARDQWLAANVAGKLVRQRITISSSFSPGDRTIVVGSPVTVAWWDQQGTLGVSAEVMAENSKPLVTAKAGAAITVLGTVRSITIESGGRYSVQVGDAKVLP
jgi:hypothetical protein